jgi:hypothetical protein
MNPERTHSHLKSAIIFAPVSLGELIDKITILEIKSQKLVGSSQKNTIKELLALKDTLKNLEFEVNADLMQQLRDVNQSLWSIEDEIRDKEIQKDFGDSFVNLARSIYKLNDRRASVKKKINLHYNSEFIEEKSYNEYQDS